ncbi:MAG: carboxypeptidase-like regulatory domain-containing protein [Polyangiaceae bacterium]|nr:carboxypeptidase-like regulatory domain-containing protein [Polyangiaceae bacterium]
MRICTELAQTVGWVLNHRPVRIILGKSMPFRFITSTYRLPRALCLSTLTLAWSGGACSPTEEENGGSGGSYAAGGSHADPNSCLGQERPADLPDTAVCVEATVGRVVDQQGAGLPDLRVTFCGPICFTAQTDSTGAFQIDAQRWLIPGEYSVQPHGSPNRTSFYYPLPSDWRQPRYEIGELVAAEMPPGEPMILWNEDSSGPQQSLQSADVVLDVPSGIQVRPAIGDVLDGGEATHFRALYLSAEDAAGFSDDLAGASVYALAPFETEFVDASDPTIPVAVGLRLPNRESWPPGSEIEFRALGTYLDVDWLPPAVFSSIGRGRVSDDGTALVLLPTTEGPGLKHLTWVAAELVP